MMLAIHKLLSGLSVLLLAGLTTAHAQSPRVVLFEDPALSTNRLHYPLLISEQRGFRILCASQEDEDAVVLGLGVVTPPSQILTAVDADVIAADPTSNPPLCPSSAEFQIKVFANDGPEGLVHYLQFPSAIGSTSFTDRIYVPGCVGLVEALEIDLSKAQVADPTPFFQGKIHEIACVTGGPIVVNPKDFTAWCMKHDRTPAETATVMAMLDATPGGVSALGNAAACAAAEEFLEAVPTLNLNGKGVESLEPLSVLPHLTNLSLAGNAVSDLSPLTKLNALTSLDLSDNDIENIVALAPLTVLTRLDLADNRIEDIRFLSALALLANLSLDGNAVLDLSPLQFLQALTDLSLARNGITGEMLEPLTGLGSLTALDLTENRIESFVHLGEFPSSVEIDLSGNPIVASGGNSFLDLCILHRGAATSFGQTVRALIELQGGGDCSTVNDALLASTTLDLSGKVLSDLRPLGVLKHLAGLNLSNNAIGDVTALSTLVNLVDLNISGNNITDIRPIAPLKKLTSFDASSNPIMLDNFLSACLMRNHDETLSEAQTNEVNVLLDISGQGICQDARDALRQKQNANATGRSLTTLDYFPVMENLRTLNVSDNNLTDLSALELLWRLTHLLARNNQITAMSAVGSLRRLELLVLDGNPLNSLNGIAVLSKLKEVWFSSTKVRRVHQLVLLPHLQRAGMRNLSLIYNSFSDYCLVHRFDSIALGSERAFMSAVETALNAARVDTSDCEAVEQWARTLTKLNLNKKSITSVKPIRFFTALQELYLYDNLIRDLAPIGKLRNLRKLNLSSNKISSLPRFQSQQMKTLSLRNNNITDPATAGGLSSLTWLDLRDNKIGSIAKARSVFARKPYLKGNPVCRLMIHLPALNDACRREPPLIAIPVTPIIIGPILTPINP